MQEIPKNFYHDVFRYSPVGIGISDGQGYIVDANEYLLELGGWKREELENMMASDFYVDGAEVRRMILDDMRGLGKLENHAVRFKRKDGTTFMTTMNVRPVIIEGEQYVVAIIKKLEES